MHNAKGILSAQSLRALCEMTPDRPPDFIPMIDPFYVESRKINGVSGGLSACSYDVHAAQDITLGVHPGFLWAQHVMAQPHMASADNIIRSFRQKLTTYPKPFKLASTVEKFRLPPNVAARVCDKSTYARLFMTAFNTHFDPAFGEKHEDGQAGATLELVNLGDKEIDIPKGTPICQFIFEWLDETTELPYDGKYANQGGDPTPAIHYSVVEK